MKFVAVLSVMIFVAAGSLSYWHGWLFLLNFCGWIIATTAYFLKYDRALLEQRLHVGPRAERQPMQKRIQLFNSVVLMRSSSARRSIIGSACRPFRCRW
ncbi:hypothetical protein [Rhizobium leguminosarum]|uniref:hypothetical protein n=1 Tax=Rhizobium leguminosarum TaxID=384 RepID=UPI0021BC14DC|nr:hypothetical protein [Rhizobium leguminosarum]